MLFLKSEKIGKKSKKNAAAYDAERPLILDFFFKSQNPRLINESGFKLRAAYDGARTVFTILILK